MSTSNLKFSACSIALGGITGSQSNGLAEEYLDCILEISEKVESNLDTITEIAELAADRTLAGGALYIRDKEGAFASEGLGRAGGLMLIRGGPEDPSIPNTFLLGSTGSFRDYDAQQVEDAQKAGDIVIAFCSHQQHPAKGYEPFEDLPLLYDIADYSVDNFLPDYDAILEINGLKICPAALVVNALTLWTFTAEFISACLRHGKMPTMWQSVFCPGSRERNTEVGKEKFHSDRQFAPIPRGELGKQYLDEMTTAMKQIKATQMDALREACSVAAEAIANGKKAYAALQGHMPPRVPGGYGEPNVFITSGFSDDDIQPGDFVTLIEYKYLPRERVDKIREKGGRSLWIAVPMDDDLEYPGLDIFVDPFWRFGDAVVTVPGYDVKMLPPSGVIQSMMYWMLSGEIAQICVDKGIEIEVNEKPW